MYQRKGKKKFFFLIVVCFIMVYLPMTARADTGEVIIITEEERDSRFGGACSKAGITVSLPEGEKDFKDLTLYFYNEAEGAFYEAKLKDVEEKSYALSLPPGTYRLDNSFTQYDGFYNYNYISRLNVESFAVGLNGIEGGEKLHVSIEGHFITQYENCLAISYQNSSHFPGRVKLTLSGETDLENPTKETYEVILKEGDADTSVLMKAGTYHIEEAVLEMDGPEGEVLAWGIEYEKGDIIIRHHEDTKTELLVYKTKQREEDSTQEEERKGKISFWGFMEFVPFLIAAICLGIKKVLAGRKRI
ncbi:MAG: hypothetical protein K2P76_16090 [Lachnospiraceae bacterium]|nr:hypothetical protein [Lachnospiraceae bacterium]